MDGERKTLTKRSVESITKALKEYGYPTITEDKVREIGDALLNGEPADVVGPGAFIRRMLRDAGAIS